MILSILRRQPTLNYPESGPDKGGILHILSWNNAYIFFFGLLILIQMVIHLSLLLRGEDYVITTLTFDDTYYYLQAAWNFKVLGFTTFDGLHSTNGLQFPWYLMLILLAFISNSKIQLIWAMMLLVILLNIASYASIWRIGNLVERRRIALLIGASLFYMQVRSSTFLMGMENSLHLLAWSILVVVLLEMIQLADQHQVRGRNLIAVSVLLSLIVWIRLDNAIYAVLLYPYVIWLYLNGSARRDWRVIFSSVCVVGAMALAMFATYYLMGNTFLPVSGLVKQSFFFRGVGHYLVTFVLRAINQTNPVLSFVLPDLASRADITIELIIRTLVASIIFLVVVGLPYSWLEFRLGAHRFREWRSGLRFLDRLVIILFVISIPHLIYTSSFRSYLSWYQTPHFIVAALITGLILDRILWITWDSYSDYNNNHYSYRVAAALLCVSLVTIGTVSLYRENVVYQESFPLYVDRLKAARWIDQHLDERIVIASWNAGQIGYFSNRTTINLDGMVNDYRFYENILSGTRPISDYLQSNKVSIVVDHTIYDHDVSDNFYFVEEISTDFDRMVFFKSPDFSFGSQSAQKGEGY